LNSRFLVETRRFRSHISQEPDIENRGSEQAVRVDGPKSNLFGHPVENPEL
jgi:hypothetical protein